MYAKLNRTELEVKKYLYKSIDCKLIVVCC